MHKPRFSLVSVFAMVIAAVVATVVMLRFGGGSSTRGFPFAWYWWADVGVIGSSFSGYHWAGLIADVLLWLAVIIAVGLFVERIAQRIYRRRESTNAGPA